jgi:hypothetical protein
MWFRKACPVVPGSLWQFTQDDSPFPRKSPRQFARVLEVKEGWVRYACGIKSALTDQLDFSLWPDCRMRLDIFQHCYPTRVQEET